MTRHDDLGVLVGDVGEGAAAKAVDDAEDYGELHGGLYDLNGVRAGGVAVAEVVDGEGGVTLRGGVVHPGVLTLEVRVGETVAVPVFLGDGQHDIL